MKSMGLLVHLFGEQSNPSGVDERHVSTTVPAWIPYIHS